ncbi:MAG: Amidohydrolase [uncultured Rubrobacteraceae bacterium]|uniref:Amidohydrolase n=1 Tax=uncultured Rubrobacteraceae bacterium TaxID=349277 RepID=A0A6J4R0K3_9ACTN|nr:MAG: Amidohydrolase [uncultured Rubrobacteraceae bacterium]
MARTTLLTNALLVDCTGNEPRERASVVVEGERIGEVRFGAPPPTGWHDAILDCAGMTLMPGLTDAHVHIGAVDVNILDQHREHPSNLVALMMARILEDTLQQGFTTVRDAGGTDWSFKAAIERGIVDGPRLLVSDRPLSQTGGHGDWRRATETESPEIFCPTAGMRSVVCDGVDEVRRAAREQLRLGADQIKVMASGGAMSPADELSATQYALEELRAAVEEAEAARTYVMAHAYNDESVRNCLESGVRSIEHGNLIDEETARLIAQAGAYLVPTLVTYEALSEEGKSYNVPEDVIRKIEEARELGIRALRYAYEAGVRIASGSDLLGPLQDRKARELEIKTEVLSPMESLLSATKTNASLFGMEEEIGTVEEGKLADLLVVEGNPLENIAVLQKKTNLKLIMKGGRAFKNELEES